MEESTLMSVKQFAAFAEINQSTLRYYDDIGLLKPEARGQDNNYRYYTPLQLTKVKFIKTLVDVGIPLTTITELIEERSPKSMMDLLTRQQNTLDHKLHEIRTAYSIIHTFCSNIQEGLMGRAGDVRIETLDAINFVLGPVTDFGEGKNYYKTFRQFCDKANEYRINLNYPVGGYHNDMECFLKEPDRPDRYFSMDPTGNVTREAGQYLVGYRQGYHGSKGYIGANSDVPQKMAAYAKENNLIFNGPVCVVYLLNEISTKEPAQFLSRISVNVSKLKHKLHY